MTPNLSALLLAADAAKQAVILKTAANETAAQLAEQAIQRHQECYADVRRAMADLAAARAAIDAALDGDYGPLPPRCDVVNVRESVSESADLMRAISEQAEVNSIVGEQPTVLERVEPAKQAEPPAVKADPLPPPAATPAAPAIEPVPVAVADAAVVAVAAEPVPQPAA